MIQQLLAYLEAMVFILEGVGPRLAVSDFAANRRLGRNVRGAHRLMITVEFP
jgi:hypothetical protein